MEISFAPKIKRTIFNKKDELDVLIIIGYDHEKKDYFCVSRETDVVTHLLLNKVKKAISDLHDK